jgi:DNA polymerase I-like protein with 3'-5' exonuclease and polymerase domains
LYPKLRRTTHDGKAVWKCGEGRNEIFLSGGKVDENIVQAIARDVISDQMIEIFKRTGLRPALIVHDEVCMIVREHNADSVLNTMNDVMRTPPKWWPELKLWSEGSIGATYGEAK